jgi:DNA-binding transcriptional LysR family regulator
VLLHADRAIQEARAVGGQHTRTWSLGFSPLVDLRIVSNVRRFLLDAHPAAELNFVSGHTSEHVNGLLQGRLDAGLIILPAVEDRVEFRGFQRERLVLAMPKDHELATKKHVEVTDLDRLPLVKIRGDIEPRFGTSLKRLFALIRIQPKIFYEATTQSEALELVKQDGVAALTTPAALHTATDQILFRKFLDEILTVETSLAYVGEPTSPILKSLQTFLFEMVQPWRGGTLRS